MSSAIEVLKELKEEVNFADMHKDRVIRLNALGEALLALEKPFKFNKEELIKFLLAYDKYVDCRDYSEEALKMTAYAFLEDIGFTFN